MLFGCGDFLSRTFSGLSPHVDVDGVANVVAIAFELKDVHELFGMYYALSPLLLRGRHVFPCTQGNTQAESNKNVRFGHNRHFLPDLDGTAKTKTTISMATFHKPSGRTPKLLQRCCTNNR